MNRMNLKTKQVSYVANCLAPVLSAPANQQLLVHSVGLLNGSGSTQDMGIALQLDGSLWKVWTLTPAPTDVTAAIQAGGTINVVDTTDGDGTLYQCTLPFGLLNFNVSQVETGTPTYTYEYWNGTAWSALTLLEPVDYTMGGQTQVIFYPPSDWVQGDGGLGADPTLYSIRLLATTAPAAAVQINTLAIGDWLAFRKGITDGSTLAIVFDTKLLLITAAESVLPYFNIASPGNLIETAYQINP